MKIRISTSVAKILLGLSSFMALSASFAEDANLTDPFYISSLQYQSQLTGYAACLTVTTAYSSTVPRLHPAGRVLCSRVHFTAPKRRSS